MDSTWVPQAGTSPTPTPAAMSAPPASTTHNMTTPPTTTSAMPAPTPTPSAPAAPGLTFPTSAVLARVSGSNAVLDLGCRDGGATCQGTAAVQSGEAPGAAVTASAAKAKKPGRAKAKLVTYATGPFDIAAGQTGSVKAKLSSAGRTLARGHRRMKVWINVTLAGTPAKVVSHQVTLRF